MKKLTTIVVVSTLVWVASEVRANEGLPSQAVMAEMGLGSMQVMSDSQASTIRGSVARSL